MNTRKWVRIIGNPLYLDQSSFRIAGDQRESFPPRGHIRVEQLGGPIFATVDNAYFHERTTTVAIDEPRLDPSMNEVASAITETDMKPGEIINWTTEKRYTLLSIALGEFRRGELLIIKPGIYECPSGTKVLVRKPKCVLFNKKGNQVGPE